jgi:hypothetical protein
LRAEDGKMRLTDVADTEQLFRAKCQTLCSIVVKSCR